MDESGNPDAYEVVKKMSCNEFIAFVNNNVNEILRKREQQKRDKK